MTETRMITAVVDDEANAEVTGSAPVPWWSFTKTTLAAAALALVAQGQLDLDGPVGRWPFTLRQLLQHRAGLANYGRLAAYHEAVRNGEAPWPRERLLREVEAGKLVFEPGQGWAYSNIGYLLVRELIEDATGQDIGMALERLVLAPLGVSGVKVASLPADLAETAWGNPTGYHPGWVHHGLLIGPAASAALLLRRLLGGALLPPAPIMSSVIRRRRGLIVAIGISCLVRVGRTTQSSQTGASVVEVRSPYRASGFVQ